MAESTGGQIEMAPEDAERLKNFMKTAWERGKPVV